MKGIVITTNDEMRVQEFLSLHTRASARPWEGGLRSSALCA